MLKMTPSTLVLFLFICGLRFDGSAGAPSEDGCPVHKVQPRFRRILLKPGLAQINAPSLHEVTVIRGNLLQLQSMITDMTGKKAVPSYSSYGCYCGIGGKGKPKDATDRCCRAHDCCYDRLEARGCRPRTTTYSYSYARGDVRCGSDRNWCKQEICSCDQALARCLKSSKGSYRWKYTFYPNILCLGSAPAC